nr:NUDIX hydrolase 14, chloroplastic [Tanacetum cinerariifolium]
MVDLASFLDPSSRCKVIPSLICGRCAEELNFLLYRGSASADVIKHLQRKEHGLREHGELIKVCVLLYDIL